MVTVLLSGLQQHATAERLEHLATAHFYRKLMVKLAYKPGSVEDSHSSRTHITARLKQPTRVQRGPRHQDTYLVLLRVGFTLPLMLPLARCALTAPFHPYSQVPPELTDLTLNGSGIFLLHWPSAHAAQTLSGTLPYGARTFLPLKTGGDCPANFARSLLKPRGFGKEIAPNYVKAGKPSPLSQGLHSGW